MRKPLLCCAGSLSAGGGAAGSDILYSVLAEWWLTDGEEPLPVAMPQPAGGAPSSSPQPAPVPQAIRCAAAERASLQRGAAAPRIQDTNGQGRLGGGADSDSGGVLCMGWSALLPRNHTVFDFSIEEQCVPFSRYATGGMRRHIEGLSTTVSNCDPQFHGQLKPLFRVAKSPNWCECTMPDPCSPGARTQYLSNHDCPPGRCSGLTPMRIQRGEHWMREGTFGGRRSMAYEAPSPEVLQALTVLVRHVTVAVGSGGGSAPGGAAPAQVRRRLARAAPAWRRCGACWMQRPSSRRAAMQHPASARIHILEKVLWRPSRTFGPFH